MDDKEAEHMVLYMKAKYLLRWKRIVLIPQTPLFIYGSNAPVFKKRIKGCFTTLWVVSPIGCDRHPSLIARMKVKEDPLHLKNGKELKKLIMKETGLEKLEESKKIFDDFMKRGDRYVAVATEKDSDYFGFNDASNALLHTFGLKAEKWESSLGRNFQGPRIVDRASEDNKNKRGIEPLENLAKTESRSVFISYKWNDGCGQKARELAYALAKLEIMSWLDIIAFPKAEYSKEFKRDSKRLDKLLQYGYKKCAAIVALGTHNYGEPSVSTNKNSDEDVENWTEREWLGKLDNKHKPLRILYPQPGHADSRLIRKSRHIYIRLQKVDPVDAALEIKEWLDSKGIP